MKPLQPVFLVLAACAITLTPGCVNSEGRLRPPDPLGRALFDALDPGPRNARSDAYYVQQNQPQYTDDVWVDGAWGRDARGQRIWIPGHWARAEVR